MKEEIIRREEEMEKQKMKMRNEKEIIKQNPVPLCRLV